MGSEVNVKVKVTQNEYTTPSFQEEYKHQIWDSYLK